MIRRDGLAGRIAAIERAIAAPPSSDQPLSRHELAELARLERDYAERFPGEIASWPMARLDDYLMSWSPSDQARRLDGLRDRNRSPAERAAQNVELMAISLMSADQLTVFMYERSLYR